MTLDRRRLLLSSARLAAWWAVFDLGQITSAWARGADLDARDNVHWFEGVSDRSISFDVPIGGIAAP